MTKATRLQFDLFTAQLQAFIAERQQLAADVEDDFDDPVTPLDASEYLDDVAYAEECLEDFARHRNPAELFDAINRHPVPGVAEEMAVYYRAAELAGAA